jgi:hypothetical protein
VTDATQSYCARVSPPAWRILGHRLHPLTLGHAHLLCASTEWRPFESYEMTDQVFATGLYICSRQWRKARLHSNAPYWFATFLAIRARITRSNLTEKGQVFADYLLWHTSGPKLRPMPESGSRGGPYARASRVMGSPVLARLRTFAAPHGGMDALFGDIYWLWAATQEAEGGLRVINSGEMTFDDYCAREDAKAQNM